MGLPYNEDYFDPLEWEAPAASAVLNLRLGQLSGAIGRTLGSGTAFPASPQIGDRFWRADEAQLYVCVTLSPAATWRAIRHPKNNLEAAANPLITDDETLGYGRGSLWINVNSNEVFLCTNPVAGSAVWQNLTGGGGGGSPLTVEEADGYPVVANVVKIRLDPDTVTDEGNGVVRVTSGVPDLSGYLNAGEVLAKGDTWVGIGPGAYTILPLGQDGQVCVVDTSTLTGFKYATPAFEDLDYHSVDTANGTLSGAVDGVNTVFTTPTPYVAGKGALTWNGQKLYRDQDYDETDPAEGVITLTFAPAFGVVGFDYFEATGALGNAATVGGYTAGELMRQGAEQWQGGEDLPQNKLAYLAPDGKAYLVDAGVQDPVACSSQAGIVVEEGGIPQGQPGSVMTDGLVGSFTGLVPGADYYADPDVPGGITAAKPQPTLGGGQIALLHVGRATNGTTLKVRPGDVDYLVYAEIDPGAWVTISHHADPEPYSRESAAYRLSTISLLLNVPEPLDGELRFGFDGSVWDEYFVEQTFLMPETATVTRIEAMLRKAGSPVTGTIGLWNFGESPVHGGSAFWSASLTGVMSFYHWVSYDVNVQLQGNTRYHLTCNRGGLSTTDVYYWATRDDIYFDGYVRQWVYNISQGGHWYAPGADALFRLYVTSATNHERMGVGGLAGAQGLGQKYGSSGGAQRPNQTTFYSLEGDPVQAVIGVRIKH